MADIPLIENQKNDLANTIESFYSAPANSTGVQVTSFTATNNLTNSVSFKAYLYDSTGAVVQSIIPFVIVKRDLYNLGPSLIGQIIPAGGSLRIECSQIGGLNFNVTGTVISL
jgi:hypothetical protein